MQLSVQFNDEPRLDTCEVDKERPDGMLPPKLAAAEPTIAQLCPKERFSLRGISA
jgi:hypothetical protein